MVRDAGTAMIALVADAPPLALIQALAPLACATRLVLGLADAAALTAQPCDLILIEATETAQARSVDLIARLRAMPEHARSPIVLLADDVAAVRYAAVAAGANDIMARTVEPLELITRLANLLELAFLRRKADHQARAMSRTLEQAVAEAALREREIIRRLTLAAEFRDDQAGDHLTRVAGCTIAIAEGLGLSEQEANDIALASTMHDIGKISIPDAILMKPGLLTEAEREEMKQHALRGYRMLNDSPSHLLQIASDIALTHHERWDGQGYPQGLRGTEIPLAGRIVAVADVFDALISERVYKKAWPPEQARRHLETHAGSHFDPDCVAAFMSRWSDITVLISERPSDTSAA